MLNPVVFHLILFLGTFALTGLICRYASVFHLVAIADERSSHAGNIATGGGLALALSFLLVLWRGFNQHFISFDLFVSLIGGSCVVALVGLWDDIKPLAIRFRMAVHTCAALWAIYWLGGLPSLHFANWQLPLGHVGPIVTFLFILWFINLYNFMDGIDGLASIQAATVTISCAFIALANQHTSDIWLYSALTVVIFGFLGWNWPKARIFMGDAGSGFLGYLFAVLILHNSQTSPPTFWIFTILLGVFLIDATLTLLRRIFMGEPFYQPHRTHSYQLLAQYWQSHQKVTALVAVINLGWLLPCALLANTYPRYSFFIALIALLPILGICIFLQTLFFRSSSKMLHAKEVCARI
jgi:Fuc2NAc and GlcNAc transferase